MKPIAVFVDSDVIVSSLISRTGAAAFLVRETRIKRLISSFSYKELAIVVERLGLEKKQLDGLVKNQFSLVQLTSPLAQLKTQYRAYVTDMNDAHIVAGAVSAKVEYLITYNIKHFKADIIKADFGIIMTTPAFFLQYLRSI